jgi:hypothetical protein
MIYSDELVKALLKEERILCWTFARRWAGQAEAPLSLINRIDQHIAKTEAYTLTDEDVAKKVDVLTNRAIRATTGA